MTLLGPAPPRFPVGISDYPRLRREGYTYVDKTPLIADVVDHGPVTLLLPRPRRFGKTLNMSTLRAFFERGGDDRADLFIDTWAWEHDGGRLRSHFQRYPLIALSFKDVRASAWPMAWGLIRSQLQRELRRLWARHGLAEVVASDAGAVALHQRMLAADAPPADLALYLPQLVAWLAEATGEGVVVLIDEYDAPMHAAWEHGYWDEALDFFRVFLASGLKDESRLFRGVLTGILKVAKENIFSGLNSVRSLSVLQPLASTRFGFTEAEVGALAASAGVAHHLDGLRAWYDGYRFGGTQPSTMYNPWSILSYLVDPSAGFQSFWKNTSSNALVHELLLAQAESVGGDIATLIGGGAVSKTVDESVPLEQLRRAPDALWSLLTFSGYLTPVTAAPTRHGYEVSLRIPNEEVLAVFEDAFTSVLRAAGPGGGGLAALVAAMLSGEVEELHARLEALLTSALSFHDFGPRPVEAVYQAFFVGLLVHLEATHRVTSNREAGFGRADILVTPRTAGPGAVLELKAVGRRETPEEALARATAQLRDRDYAAEVRAAGATVVHQYAVVFDGKRCWVAVP